jgi:hypothetical protein
METEKATVFCLEFGLDLCPGTVRDPVGVPYFHIDLDPG